MGYLIKSRRVYGYLPWTYLCFFFYPLSLIVFHCRCIDLCIKSERKFRLSFLSSLITPPLSFYSRDLSSSISLRSINNKNNKDNEQERLNQNQEEEEKCNQIRKLLDESVNEDLGQLFDDNFIGSRHLFLQEKRDAQENDGSEDDKDNGDGEDENDLDNIEVLFGDGIDRSNKHKQQDQKRQRPNFTVNNNINYIEKELQRGRGGDTRVVSSQDPLQSKSHPQSEESKFWQSMEKLEKKMSTRGIATNSIYGNLYPKAPERSDSILEHVLEHETGYANSKLRNKMDTTFSIQVVNGTRIVPKSMNERVSHAQDILKQQLEEGLRPPELEEYPLCPQCGCPTPPEELKGKYFNGPCTYTN